MPSVGGQFSGSAFTLDYKGGVWLKPAWKERVSRDSTLIWADRTSWHHGCGGLYEMHKIYVIFL